jgi:hypothetical protein
MNKKVWFFGIAAVILFLLWGVVSFFYFWEDAKIQMRSGEYSAAFSFLQQCDNLNSHLGVLDAIKSPGDLLKCTSISGEERKGRSILSINVTGSKGRGTVVLKEKRVSRTDWQVISAEFVDEKGKSSSLFNK